MREFSKATMVAGALLTALFLAILATETSRECPVVGELSRTEPIRRNMERLQNVLMTVERHLDAIPHLSEASQIAMMNASVSLLKEYLLPHLDAEEAVLYPAVDRLFAGTSVSWTEALRREHQIFRRWIEEMEAQANASMPDAPSFVRRGERLLGLIEAHFEVDAETVLPLLDGLRPLTSAR
jgi:hemerythrin-like domain-containing protein